MFYTTIHALQYYNKLYSCSDNTNIISYNLGTRLSQGCNKLVHTSWLQPCNKVVTRLSFLYGILQITQLTVVLTSTRCLAHDITLYLHRFACFVIHYIDTSNVSPFPCLISYAAHGPSFARLWYYKQGARFGRPLLHSIFSYLPSHGARVL